MIASRDAEFQFELCLGLKTSRSSYAVFSEIISMSTAGGVSGTGQRSGY
jgi:hypothetical protein